MENLAAIMSSDKGQVETLTETNAKLVDQVKDLTATNSQLAIEITTLTKIITNMSGAQAPTENHVDANYNPDGYCWSHGYRCTYNHNSKTCRAKKPGHKDEATQTNTMGGSTVNKNWVKRG